VTVFADLWQVGYPAIPQNADVAKVAKIGWKYDAKVVDEITNTGNFKLTQISKKLNKTLPEENEANFCCKMKTCFCSCFGPKM
jgi:hypothetical protein